MPQPLLRQALEPWCAAGATGAMRVQEDPGGVVYLVDGRIAYAECSAASGAERLLAASGRIPAEVWRAAVSAGRPQRRISDELVAKGHITTAEFLACCLVALHDAALFLFDLALPARFEHGVRQPFGELRTLDLHSVCQEVDRRKRLLTDAWADATIDTAAVLPVRRLPGQCVALTALQWEVVAAADRRRSPVDLARLLGRDTFSVLLEVRKLARSGLVEPGRPAGSVASVRARAVAAIPAPPMTPDPPPMVLVSTPEPSPQQPKSTSDSSWEGLPQRTRTAAAAHDGDDRDWVSDQLLLRLIAGIAAL